MDLDFDIEPIVRKAAKTVDFEVVRPVEERDLRAMRELPPVKPPELKKIHQRHHFLARIIASGVSMAEASAITGYAPATISNLKTTPAFEELIEFYRETLMTAADGAVDKIATLRDVAVVRLTERLTDDEEAKKVKTDALNRIIQTTADRTGLGPRTTSVNVNIGIAERLEAARKRVAEPRSPSGLEDRSEGDRFSAGDPPHTIEGEVLDG